MEIDTQKIDEALLGLLYLTLHDERRAWKGADWDALARLHEKGFIDNPATKAKSVVFTEDGLREAKHVFEKQFTKQTQSIWRKLPGRTDTEVRPADGTTGFICKDAIDRKPFFRIYESDGTFTDYDLHHDDLEVTITHEALASFYKSKDRHVLDHSPQVLGLDEQQK